MSLVKYQTPVYTDAEAFLAAVRGVHRSISSAARDWVFRGLGDANYALVPSALRPDVLENALDENDKVGTQRQREHRAISRFFAYADAQGLDLPGDWNDMHAHLLAKPGKAWPQDTLVPLVAMAQHYGLPTRLLDWSRKPLIACYFAAADAAAHAPESGELAVWALRRRAETPKWSIEKLGVRDLSAPRGSNANLHLQSGRFTMHTAYDAKVSGPTTGPGKHSLCLATHLESKDVREGPGGAVLVQYRLAATQAGHLLSLLADEHAHAATVYAGYEGAVRATKERPLRKR
ncbi:FRG domain-containing protein [Myxococcota bacterium]|nr:FRG domain-containing protein [Myxococcota bacterium]